MRVLAIRGRNLASLEGEFSIDFTSEPLCSAGIYAISGPTGSGKSTLLDAMCLAFFSRTPRTDQARETNVRVRDVNDGMLSQGDPRFLLRRGCASGYAEVDFLALDCHSYRVRWSVSRAREKENGRLKNATITLYNIETGKEEQGTKNELQARIVELIGLTFEQFTRSVLLAQNDFSTFLKAEQGDKASLLEKLTGTELYSAISRLIYSRNSEAKSAYENLQSKARGIELLSDEDLLSMRENLKHAEELNVRLEKAKMERQALVDAVKMSERHIEEKSKQRDQNGKSLELSMSSLKRSVDELKNGEERLALAEEQEKQIRSELREARRLDAQLELAIRSMKEAKVSLDDIARGKSIAEARLRQIEVKCADSQKERDSLLAWRERYRKKEAIAERIGELLLHLDSCMNIRIAIDNSSKNLEAIRRRLADMERSVSLLRKEAESNNKELAHMEREKSSVESALKELDAEMIDSKLEQMMKERETLLVEQARFVTTGDIKSLRNKLVDGSPCPVCGSINHPFASRETHDHILALADMISRATISINELQRRRNTLLNYRKRMEFLVKDELELHKRISDKGNRIADISSRMGSLKEQGVAEERNISELGERLSKSLTVVNELFGNEMWQSGWQSDPEDFRNKLSAFATEWKRNGERTIEVERYLSAVAAECESFSSFMPSLLQQHAEALKFYEEKSSQYNALQRDRSVFFGGKSADEVERDFNEKLDSLRSGVKAMRDTVAKRTAEVEQFRGISEQIKRDLAAITAQLESRHVELLKWESSFKTEFDGTSLDNSLTASATLKSELMFRLRTDDENRRKLVSMGEELDKLRLASERWAKLNELAGSADGAKFRRIAQGYTLDLLLGYANVQLRQLSRRYRLERVPDTLALQVIDHEMCDEIRTVHSLSGGESFLVSLALALGLSSLSSNRMRVESLFIDEGFGSLDAETLRVAMDALENLRTQGRKIGVISHVQEMSERIPVQIRVNRSGNGRSKVEVVG